LSASHEINVLAVFATPELQHVLNAWIGERKAATLLADGEKEAAALTAALQVS
jgi:hypothetical protein